MNSNSSAHLEAPTPFNVKGSNSNMKIDAFPGPTSSPSFSAHCSRCLGKIAKDQSDVNPASIMVIFPLLAIPKAASVFIGPFPSRKVEGHHHPP